MKKKLIGMTMALLILIGSSMSVCAEEAAAPASPVQNYQQVMTPEILASFAAVTVDSDLSVVRNALVMRTDVWGQLQDADGDGIDDRDPINGCGYLDLNCNGFDDRFETAFILASGQEDPVEAFSVQLMLNMLTHRCKHGCVSSSFEYEEDLGCFISMPDYFEKCPDCTKELMEVVEAYFAE